MAGFENLSDAELVSELVASSFTVSAKHDWEPGHAVSGFRHLCPPDYESGVLQRMDQLDAVTEIFEVEVGVSPLDMTSYVYTAIIESVSIDPTDTDKQIVQLCNPEVLLRSEDLRSD